MYGNVKTRFRGNSGMRRPSGFKGRSHQKNSTDTSLYVNKAADLPVEEEFIPKHRFSDFGLNQQIVDRIARRGYIVPTPIQDQSIPHVLSRKDVIGIADTGTGKTAAFLLPLLHQLLANRSAKALIMVPSRELAVQIEEELREFSEGLHIFSALCIGGGSMGTQIRSLNRNPQFIIGTPGRLKDLYNRRVLRLNQITHLVLDEADRMVDMGFIADIRYLIAQVPEERQSLFFSATIMPEVKALINSFMNNPLTVSVKKRDTSTNVDQDIVRYTNPFEKLTLLHEMLTREEFKKVLIFGRTKHGVEKLHQALLERGFSSVSIHGNKSQGQRQRALQEFKENRTQIMVATDVASRGLDIPDVTHVINYEAPENYADYIHRIGRTGRANKKGKALTFVH